VTRRILAVVVALGALAGAGCRWGGEPTTGPTPSAAPLTSLGSPSPSSTVPSTTLAPLEGAGPVAYSIVARTGDTVVVLVDGDGSLTDLDVYDVLADVVEEDPTIATAYVVDHPDAVELVGRDDLSAAEEAFVDDHLLARLVEGNRVVYEGPFAESGSAIIGS